jgi:deoxyribose-phosphate aldolase
MEYHCPLYPTPPLPHIPCVVQDTPMTPLTLAGKIDHTILKPESTSAQVHRVIAEAMEHHCASACVAPAWAGKAAIMLRGSGVKTCSVVAFPHGTSKPTIKAIEAASAAKEGVDEIDVVAFLPNLLRLDVDAARAELMEIVRATRAARREVVVKVIVESALLMGLGADRGEEAIAAACRAVRESGCDYIKTSTGFHPAGGASVEAVRLMKKYAEGLLVKAAGGIRDLPTALAMLDAGADRIGCSSTVTLLTQAGRMEGGLA